MLTPASPARGWLVLVAVLPGIFLTLADATVMSVAIPQIIRSMTASVIAVSWVMNGYNLVLTVLFLTDGAAGRPLRAPARVRARASRCSRWPRIGCATADTVQVLIALPRGAGGRRGRGRAGVAGAAHAGVPGAPPGFAAGLFGALSSAAAAFGPVLGGVLVQRWDWPAIFWFNLPVGALGVVLALALIPRRPRDGRRRPLDWVGVALSCAGLLCLTLAIIQGNEWGWLSAPILGLFAGAAAILAGFVLWELRIPSPLFDLRHFRDRTWAAASAAIMTVDIAMMGAMFMLVIFMVAMMDYTELKAGLDDRHAAGGRPHHRAVRRPPRGPRRRPAPGRARRGAGGGRPGRHGPALAHGAAWTR